MGVNAHEVEETSGLDLGHRRSCCPTGHGESKFGIFLTRLDEGVGVGVHPRRDPDPHLRRDSGGRSQGLESRDLISGIDDDAPDTNLKRRGQFRHGLIVPVEAEALRVDTRSERDGHLAARRDVDRHSCGTCDLRHCDAPEGLRRERHARSERRNRLLAASTEMRFVVDEHRRAELRSEFGNRNATHRESPLVVEARVGRQQRPRHRGCRVHRVLHACRIRHLEIGDCACADEVRPSRLPRGVG